MGAFIDLSHVFEDGMPGFRLRQPGGGMTQFSATVRPFLTHEQSRPLFDGQAEFEITEMRFHTSIGTYLDSPYHRWAERRDIGALSLEETILPGIAVDVRGHEPRTAVGPEVLPADSELLGRAVLFNFGWDTHWGTEAYFAYPFLGEAVLQRLIGAGVRLVGVDTINVDHARNPARPAHSWLLAREVLIVENLTHLERLHGRAFRFFAAPLRVRGAAAMPVRAFAELAPGDAACGQ